MFLSESVRLNSSLPHIQTYMKPIFFFFFFFYFKILFQKTNGEEGLICAAGSTTRLANNEGQFRWWGQQAVIFAHVWHVCRCLSILRTVYMFLFFRYRQGKHSSGQLMVLVFIMWYLFPGDGGQQKRLRLSHQRPSPSDHHSLHQADPGHQTVDHGLHESGAVRLSVGG